MKTTAIVLALLSICLSTWAAASNAQTEEDQVMITEERQAIEATLLQYEKALNDSDVKGVLELYAPDGVFMPSGAPTAIGTEEVKATYEHVFGAIKLDIKFTFDEIVQSGNYAFARTISRGQVTILADGVTAPEENRELFVLQRRDGTWKIARYMFNKMSSH